MREVASLRRDLLRWYDENARDLPWRRTDDPYAIWVSEVMSQQTRVATVIAYWTRWLELFPDIAALASAERDEVMNAWAGLGYYRRARALHDAARLVVTEHASRLPDTAAELRTLPGIGDYTAGAIASIAHGEPVPAIDGNVTRVVSRLAAIDGDPGRAPFRNAIREVAEALLDDVRPGDFNQAMMELGATVCTPRSPSCDACPLADRCEALAQGRVDELPPAARRTPPRPQTTHALLVIDGSDVLLTRRPTGGLLGDMWTFPTGESLEAALTAVEAATAGTASAPRRVGRASHVFSHIAMTYEVWTLHASRRSSEDPHRRWVALAALDEAGLPTAMRKVLDTFDT